MRVTLFEFIHLRTVLIFESAHFPGMHRVHNVSIAMQLRVYSRVISNIYFPPNSVSDNSILSKRESHGTPHLALRGAFGNQWSFGGIQICREYQSYSL